MSSASSCQNGFCIDAQQILIMRNQATNMAKHMISNDELIKMASDSSDVTHRVASAFAYGLKKQVHENLYKLIEDQNDLVVQAARESFVYIASTKYNKRNADFGPFPGYGYRSKSDASNIWRLFFQDKNIKVVAPAASATAKKPSLSDIYGPEGMINNPNGKKPSPFKFVPQDNKNEAEEEQLPTDRFDPDWLTVKAKTGRNR